MIYKKKDQVVSVAKHQLLNRKSLTNNNELLPLYHKNKIFSFFREKKLVLSTILFSFFCLTNSVFAVEEIEGGSITIDSLGKIIQNLARQIQVFGIILSFIAMVVFVIQFIIGDDETKQRKKKTIIYTLGGVALLILIPSLINIIIKTLD